VSRWSEDARGGVALLLDSRDQIDDSEDSSLAEDSHVVQRKALWCGAVWMLLEVGALRLAGRIWLMVTATGRRSMRSPDHQNATYVR